MGSHTAFFSFLVRGLPDFVSSEGGAGGAGTERDDDASITRSASRSRMADGASYGDSPNVI